MTYHRIHTMPPALTADNPAGNPENNPILAVESTYVGSSVTALGFRNADK